MSLLDRREMDHNKTLIRDLFAAHDKTMRELGTRDDRNRSMFEELEQNFTQSLAISVQSSEKTLRRSFDDKLDVMAKE